MPWIDTPHEDEWGPELEEIKSEVVDPDTDRVDWIMRIHALDFQSMDAHNVIYRQAMKSTKTLRKVEREMIAVVVSQANECHY